MIKPCSPLACKLCQDPLHCAAVHCTVHVDKKHGYNTFSSSVWNRDFWGTSQAPQAMMPGWSNLDWGPRTRSR